VLGQDLVFQINCASKLGHLELGSVVFVVTVASDYIEEESDEIDGFYLT